MSVIDLFAGYYTKDLPGNLLPFPHPFSCPLKLCSETPEQNPCAGKASAHESRLVAVAPCSDQRRIFSRAPTQCVHYSLQLMGSAAWGDVWAGLAAQGGLDPIPECPRRAGGDTELWGQVGHSLDWMGWEGFSSLNNSVVLMASFPSIASTEELPLGVGVNLLLQGIHSNRFLHSSLGYPLPSWLQSEVKKNPEGALAVGLKQQPSCSWVNDLFCRTLFPAVFSAAVSVSHVLLICSSSCVSGRFWAGFASLGCTPHQPCL